MVIVAGMEPRLYDATMTAAVPGPAVMLVRWNRAASPLPDPYCSEMLPI